MSSPSGLPAAPITNREMALIMKVIQKTAQKRLIWRRQQSALVAATANGLQADFIVSTPIFGTPATWVTFTVRDQGKELVKIQRSTNALSAGLFGQILGTPPAVIQLVDNLFAMVSGSAEDDIDQALRKLDQI